MYIIRLFLIALYSFLLSLVAILSALIDRSNTTYWWIVRIYGRGVLLLAGIRLKITGLENFDHNEAYVFVANHMSNFDISALQAGIPNRARMFFKKELGRIPFFGWQLVLGPYFSVDRKNAEKAMKTIEDAKNVMLTKKDSVLLFAEGTRSKDGTVQPFKRGAFNLAVKVKHPVVPVSISGTNKIMQKGSLRIYSGRDIIVHFDKPISTEDVNTRQEEIALMEKVREIIIANKVDL